MDFSELGYIRVSAVSPKLRIGNIQFNVNEILHTLEVLERKSVQIAVFPELCLSGYTCGDLFYQEALLSEVRKGLQILAENSAKFKLLFIVGFPLFVDSKLYNCAALIGKGKIYGIVHKTFIPNTREFYEKRWFTSLSYRSNIALFGEEIPFGNNLIFEDKEQTELTFGVEICQDLWAVEPISTKLAQSGAKLIFNLSASDEWIGKAEYRRNLVLMQSARVNCGYVYAGSGAWESTTDMVFSGHCIIAENGKLLAESRDFSFETKYIVADVDLELLAKERTLNDTFFGESISEPRVVWADVPRLDSNELQRKVKRYPFIPEITEDRAKVCNEVFEIQTTGLARRLLHTNTKDVVIGVSGGLDSTLALLVCVNAFRRLNFDYKGIHSIVLPGFGTSKQTFANASKLPRLLGVSVEIIDIKRSVSLHLKDLQANSEQFPLVFENAQARERTQILMDLANKYNGIVVGTGDLSEIALGWSTYNADHISMYNVNAGVPKTLVRFVIQWASENLFSGQVRKILNKVLSLPSSPELVKAEGDKITQITEEIVGPFELNDFFLYYSIRYGFKPSKIAYLAKIAFEDKYSMEELHKWLVNYYRRFFVNQFKRSCMPDGPKVGAIDLSPRGSWRMPSDADFVLWLNEIEQLTKNYGL
ncbi:MAG: NAD(+) synthase [Candidatus Kapaibacteriota bacterium]